MLANDHDANCDPVRIAGFDATSALGGTVALSPGTGSKGQAELVYTPPPTPFLGQDQFQYTAGDWFGGTMAGTVTIDVRPQRLEAYWPLDDGSGSTAADATGLGFDGTLSGGPAWIAGPFGGALAFDGADDDVAVPPMNLQTDTLSITAWLRLDGPQTQQPGIVFSRDASTAAGLSVAIGDELRYEWDGILWKSGLVVPQGVWTFVALVVEPTRATIWMDDGTGLRSATTAVPHGVEEFDGTLRLGWDEKKPTRRLFGALDDVRIHGWALDAQEIADLRLRGGPAVIPIPPDGGTLADTTPSVSWTPGLLATSHDIYFGTDYTAVEQATKASPEYQGSVLSSSFPTGLLAAGTTYFWRVDEIAGGPIVTGQTWQFQPTDDHHWRLDETSGTVAVDSHGTLDGLYIASPLLGVPGATPKTATAVDFDGVIQHVYLPAMNLASDHVSITAWVRRSGVQSPFAGLVFSRAVSTVAGLNVGNANDLGYHWNDDPATWGWSSGLLLPDQKWVFVALVVEPARATLWMGEDGTLTSAVNTVPHAIEEFDGPTEIARDAAGGRLFRGRVDDVRVYDGALTPAEVRDLFQGSL